MTRPGELEGPEPLAGLVAEVAAGQLSPVLLLALGGAALEPPVAMAAAAILMEVTAETGLQAA